MQQSYMQQQQQQQTEQQQQQQYQQMQNQQMAQQQQYQQNQGGQQQMYQAPQGQYPEQNGQYGGQQQQQQQQNQYQQPQYGQQQQQQQQQPEGFRSIQPRTREERNQMGDREHIEQARLRDRIGQYHKYVDNALVNAPDPTSSHFLPENDRFNKDFAANDKMRRESEIQRKQQVVDSRRIQKYERDLKRWEFMEQENDRGQQKIDYQKDKYHVGNANKGGAAYNILNLNYEQNQEGDFLKQKDHDSNVRALLRSKNVDTLSNNQFNLVNGAPRQQIDIPEHRVYNPPGSSGSQMARAGAAVFGDGFAGRPIRVDSKQFGKRTNNPVTESYDSGSMAARPPLPYSNGGQIPPQANQYNSQVLLPTQQQQQQLYGQPPQGQYGGNGAQYGGAPAQAPIQTSQFASGGAGTKFW